MESIPKIEGHATFYAHLKAGRIEKAQMIGLENDRFVEKILFGRKFYEAPIITSRICGICPTIHNITSTRAIEDACGITPTKQTKNLRRLMLCGQIIQSHSLHLYLLVLPDFVGSSSSFELQKNHPDLFENAIILKQYADAILDVIGGRAVHPISNVPGGFKKFPEKASLKKLLELSLRAEETARKTLSLFAGFSYPKISRKILYSGLIDTEYGFYQGKVLNSSGEKFSAKNYNDYIYEELRHYTRAKFATLKGKEMMVGAMARINLNFDQLEQTVKKVMEDLNIPASPDNPFDNIVAQAIENYHFVVLSKNIIETFIKKGLDKKEPVKPPQKHSKGTAACEAPRGTLFHHYELDKEGYIVQCDIITPTVQNLPAMELDMKNLAPVISDMEPEERNKTIEMLIRAYDPCITCATH